MKTHFLSQAAIVFVLCCITACKNEPKNQEMMEAALTYERVNANTSETAERVLALYAYGQRITQSMDCTEPASWYYQGSIHSVPKRKEIEGSTVELCPSYPVETDSLTAWNSCPHMYDTNKQLNFLTWHRLYTYYHERNLRHYIANGVEGYPGLGTIEANAFSLPYWDYTNDAGMPVPFAEASFQYEYIDIEENPLYEKGRSRTLMEGFPIDYKSKDSIAINIGNGEVKNLCLRTMKQALDYDQFLELSNVSEFSRALEDRLHNVMHDYIGGAVDPIDLRGDIYNRIYQSAKSGFGLMGQIPSAGFDPIFFLHHANVDRLFASWEALYRPLTIEDMNTYGGSWNEVGHIYRFWDAATDSWVTYDSMQAMLDACHSIDYSYQELASFEAGNEAVTAQKQVLQNTLLVEQQAPQDEALNEVAEAFTVDLPDTWTKSEGYAKYALEIDLAFGSNMFQQLVVLTLPPDMDWNACDLDPEYIHSVSAFFGSTHAQHAGMHGESEAGKAFQHRILVDVTKAVSHLQDGEDLKVYIVPLNTENGPDFYVTKLRLFEQQ